MTTKDSDQSEHNKKSQHVDAISSRLSLDDGKKQKQRRIIDDNSPGYYFYDSLNAIMTEGAGNSYHRTNLIAQHHQQHHQRSAYSINGILNPMDGLGGIPGTPMSHLTGHG